MTQTALGVVFTDEAGAIVAWNPGAEAFTGIPCREAVGKKLWEIHQAIAAPPDDRSGPSRVREAALRDALRTGELPVACRGRESRIVHRDGHTATLQPTVFAVRTDAGFRLGLLVVDITDRRRIEEALHRSDERYRIATAQTGQLVYEYEVASGSIRWSGSTEEILGYSAAELEQMDIVAWEEHVHPDDRARAITALAEAQRRGAKYLAEYRFRRRDGRYLLMENTGIFVRSHDGALVRMIGTMKDVTAQRQAELEHEQLADQLRQAQKMESIGRLAGGVAHDFNNLLTAICGHVELALLNATPDHELQENLRQIQRAALSAAAVAQRLLAFSRKQVIEPQAVDLNRLLHGLRDMLTRLIGEDVECAIETAADLWTARVDPHQLEHVIVNLALNARDAMPGGGRLVLATDNVTRASTTADATQAGPVGDYVRLTVEDSGVGMSDEVKAHLFEPFFTTKPVGRGSGLGLATVYGVIRQQGGFISAFSEIGQGTRFEILLPRELSERPAPPPPLTPAVLPRGHETIMLVEDEAEVRSMAVSALTRAGYHVIACASADEAVATYTHGAATVDLLLTDVVMPGMNGQALADTLRRRTPTLKILFCSGYTRDLLNERIGVDTAVDFLAKPYGPRELAVKVREMLDRPTTNALTAPPT